MNFMKHSEYLENVKDKSLEIGSLTEELYQFYKSLYLYIEDYEDKFNEIDEEIDFITDSVPGIDIDKIKISPAYLEIFNKSIEAVTEIIKISHSGFFFDVFVKRHDEDDKLLERSIQHLLKREYADLESLSKEFKIGFDEYLFILINVLKPYFLSLQKRFFSADVSEWFEHKCPFCGQSADMNKLVEAQDNQRILHCSLCEYEWKFKRITCAICGNDDHDKVGFFTFDDDKKYRVDYCDDCKGYLKTIRIFKQDEESKYDLVVENLISNFLDATMIEKGYNR